MCTFGVQGFSEKIMQVDKIRSYVLHTSTYLKLLFKNNSLKNLAKK